MRNWGRRCEHLVRDYVLRRSEPTKITAAKLLATSPGPALIVAAHPDDEVIGAAALLSRLHCVDVLYVTDGAPRNGRFPGFTNRLEYAATRRRESAAVLEILGNKSTGRWLGIPDQEVTTLIADFAQQLVEILVNYQIVVTHAYEGGHPDHDATALSVQAACRLIERKGDSVPNLLEMTGSHRYGGRVVRGIFIPHWDAGPVAELRLTRTELDLKRRMFACYATQQKVLKKFSPDVERFRSAPRYDFLIAPHRGPLLYDGFGWGITGRAWRTAARQALRCLALPDDFSASA
jgi:LmbE family N-acetylglucosaminyl deacetylase